MGINTIDTTLLMKVANELPHLRSRLGKGAVVHTVTVTLNGQGGADIIVEGIDGTGGPFRRTGVTR